MTDPYLAEIRMFGGNFAPRGWALCNGQTLPIAQNTAVFSLLGTSYGGNGTTTFQLPDLQGRSPMHWGNGAGLQTRALGEQGGTESVTLLSTEMPQHSHAISGATIANSNPGETPASNTLFTTSAPNQLYATSLNPGGLTLAPQSITFQGGNQPHNNQQPFLVVTFIFCLSGIFPARN